MISANRGDILTVHAVSIDQTSVAAIRDSQFCPLHSARELARFMRHVHRHWLSFVPFWRRATRVDTLAASATQFGIDLLHSVSLIGTAIYYCLMAIAWLRIGFAWIRCQ